MASALIFVWDFVFEKLKVAQGICWRPWGRGTWDPGTPVEGLAPPQASAPQAPSAAPVAHLARHLRGPPLPPLPVPCPGPVPAQTPDPWREFPVLLPHFP